MTKISTGHGSVYDRVLTFLHDRDSAIAGDPHCATEIDASVLAILEITGADKAQTRIAQYAAEEARIVAQRDEAVEALEPFARAGRMVEGDTFGPALFRDGDTAFNAKWKLNGQNDRITWCDLRRAAATLKSIRGE